MGFRNGRVAQLYCHRKITNRYHSLLPGFDSDGSELPDFVMSDVTLVQHDRKSGHAHSRLIYIIVAHIIAVTRVGVNILFELSSKKKE